MSWWLILAAVIGLADLTIMWLYLMHDYQRTTLTLLDPEKDPLGAGYHILQSKIALVLRTKRKGWMQGTQSQLEFLRSEPHTDLFLR